MAPKMKGKGQPRRGVHIRVAEDIDALFSLGPNNGGMDLAALESFAAGLEYETPTNVQRAAFAAAWDEMDDVDEKEPYLYADDRAFPYLMYNRKIKTLFELRSKKFDDFNWHLFSSNIFYKCSCPDRSC